VRPLVRLALSAPLPLLGEARLLHALLEELLVLILLGLNSPELLPEHRLLQRASIMYHHRLPLPIAALLLYLFLLNPLLVIALLLVPVLQWLI